MAKVSRSSKQFTPAKSHKRQLSNSDTPNTVTSATRSSKRIKESELLSSASKTTPTKSKYFEHSLSDEESQDESSAEAESQSGYEDEDDDDDVSQNESVEDTSETEEYNSEDEPRRKKRKAPQRSKNTTSSPDTLQNKELWREGVKTGLGPGKQVIIAKPKARGDGGINYVPEKIHPNTFEFLRDLKKNNDRQWLKAHDPDYRQAWKDFESFVETLTEKISEIDETIPELPPKDLVFRIYRDVRFSSDPTPYKPHFSAAWSRTGRKGPYACYYLHIQPGGKCFVGSGLWHPEAAPIHLLRADIDQHSERLIQVLSSPQIRKDIFGGISNDKKKVIKAFTMQNADNALKTKPKGFDADHPNIELLRLRNFTIGQKVSDSDILSSKGLDRVLELVRAVQPFVAYLNNVVMPDENDDEGDQPPSNEEDASLQDGTDDSD